MSGQNKNLIDAILCAGTTGSVWSESEKYLPECKATIKLIVALLVSKLNRIQNFDYEKRLYAYFIRPFCGVNENEIRQIIDDYFLQELSSFSIDELIEGILLESGRNITKEHFVACLDELRSIGHIEDSEGRIDMTEFSQFVNAYFFLNEDNRNRFIKNLYQTRDASPTEYFSQYELDLLKI